MAQPSGSGPAQADVSAVGHALAHVSILANLAGALIVYLYLQFLAPDAFNPHRSSQGAVASAVAFVIYMVLAVPTSLLWMRPSYRAGAALAEGRPLTERQRKTILGTPRRIASFTALGWSGAAVLFAAMNANVGNPAGLVVHVTVGILLGGLVTTAITYLLVERRFRTSLIAALDGQPRPARAGAIRGRLLLAWAVGSGVPMVAVALTPFEHRGTGVVSVAVSVAVLAGIGLLAGYVVTATTAASVSEPLSSVRRVLNSVRSGDLSVQVEVDDPGEIGLLQADVNRMVAGLREREALADLFGRHVGEAVARKALEQGPVALGGTQRQASVLFVDLIGSTTLALTRPAPEVVSVLNTFFGCVVQTVTEEGGWVNKFEGDGALCVFGVPDDQPDHAARALRAARRLRQALVSAAADIPGLDAGVGVAGGTVVAGNIGAVDRYEYTVIGDPVNEAARLSELAKTDEGRLLASAPVLCMAGPDEVRHWEPEGEAVLRGRHEPTVVMRPVPAPAGLAAPLDPIRPAEAVGRQPPATAGTIETV